MKTTYKIEVICEPQDGEYFWCILGYNGNDWYNSGICGWELTLNKALETAYKKYQFFTDTAS